MVQQSTNQPQAPMLVLKHISKATDEAISYIKARKANTIKPLKTRWKKINRVCGGGLEPGMVLTVAGASGSGKSAFVNTLETDLIDLNPDTEIVVLSFSFEMLSYRQVGRKLSNKLKRTTSELYSAEEELSDASLVTVEKEAKHIKDYPIYYADSSGTVDEIKATIEYVSENQAKGKWLVIIMDHVVLVEGDSERKTVSDLQKLFIKVKKRPFCSIIQLSQLNRNPESPERINNPSGHYPLRSDLFASDSIYHASDFIAVLSRPELLGILAYGPKRLIVQNKIYMHFIKVREGEQCILEFDNGLKYGDLIEPQPIVSTEVNTNN